MVASCVSAKCSAGALANQKLYFSFCFTIVVGTLTDRVCCLLLVLAKIFFALKSGRFTPSLLISFASSSSWRYDSSLLFAVVAFYVSSYRTHSCMRSISRDTQ